MTIPFDLITANLAMAADDNVNGWRVFYDDGSTADSNASLLSDLALSIKKIQAVMIYQKDEYAPGKCYRQIYQGYDLYMIDGVQLLGGVADNYSQASDAAMAAEAL